MTEQIPKYRVIAQYYRSRVTSGELAPGSVLESRRKLASKHETSRVTIDKVVELLTAEGILEPSDGNRPPVVADISHRTATVVDRVASASSKSKRALGPKETSRILSVEMVPCPGHIARRLGVEPGEEVLCRSRLNLVEGRPVATGYSYYPPEVTELTPELKEAVSLPTGSRELAAERMRSKQKRLHQRVTSRLATDEERALLELGGSYNVVSQVTRTVYLANGKVVECAVKIFEGNQGVESTVDL